MASWGVRPVSVLRGLAKLSASRKTCKLPLRVVMKGGGGSAAFVIKMVAVGGGGAEAAQQGLRPAGEIILFGDDDADEDEAGGGQRALADDLDVGRPQRGQLVRGDEGDPFPVECAPVVIDGHFLAERRKRQVEQWIEHSSRQVLGLQQFLDRPVNAAGDGVGHGILDGAVNRPIHHIVNSAQDLAVAEPAGQLGERPGREGERDSRAKSAPFQGYPACAHVRFILPPSLYRGDG